MTQETSLTVSKLIRAPRAKVFAAWTTPEIMDRARSELGLEGM